MSSDRRYITPYTQSEHFAFDNGLWYDLRDKTNQGSEQLEINDIAIAQAQAFLIEARLMAIPDKVFFESARLLGATDDDLHIVEVESKRFINNQMNVLSEDVDNIRDAHSWAIGYSDPVIAAMASAVRSHEGQYRKNGPRYYSHPAQTAEIIDYAIGRYAHEHGEIDPALRDRLLVLGLSHDTLEHAIERVRGPLFSYRNFLASPMLLNELFEQAGQRESAKKIGKNLLAITKVKLIDPEFTEKLSLERIVENPEVIVSKAADTQQNDKHDPVVVSDGDTELAEKVRRSTDRYERTAVLYAQTAKVFGRPYSELVKVVQSTEPHDIPHNRFSSVETSD